MSNGALSKFTQSDIARGAAQGAAIAGLFWLLGSEAPARFHHRLAWAVAGFIALDFMANVGVIGNGETT